MIISRVLSTISIIGVFGLIGYEYIQAIELQHQLQSFVNKGPRFTAQDGQELCERVKALETSLGKPQLDCLYNVKR